MYTKDSRIVLTLDAGGTNFVFSAMQGNQEIVQPITLPSQAENLENCLNTLVQGFTKVLTFLPAKPVAISFAFPGPADYPNGIIGDLPNFPSFRGGIPLKAFLENHFKLPVFINNDGALFAYGEAIAGSLVDVNQLLTNCNNPKQYKNLIGVTLGTGFGCGVVINNQLVIGDNALGGSIWVFRNKKYQRCFVEESVSIRAVQRVYQELSKTQTLLTPKDIFLIAEGVQSGNREAAIQSYAELGEMAANAMADALTLVDGIMVIGGGVAGAHKYIIPTMLKEFNSKLDRLSGDSVNRLQQKVYYIDDPEQAQQFANTSTIKKIKVPNSNTEVLYNSEAKSAITVSKLGASKAIAIGAYSFALQQL